MEDSDRYRRKEDEGAKLLVLLNERVQVLQQDVKGLAEARGKDSYDVLAIRLKYLERVFWFVGSTVFLLAVRAIFNFFAN